MSADDLAAFAGQHCPDVMVVVDPDGAVQFASDSVRRVLGFSPEEHMGAAIWDFVHPEDLVAAAGAVSEASRSTGYHQPAVFRIRHEDGHWIECEVNGSTLEGADGAWLVLAIRCTGDRDELMGRRRRIEQLIRMASLECSSVPWDAVDALVERYLQDLAGVVGAELVELAWEEADADLRIGARWPVVRVRPGRERPVGAVRRAVVRSRRPLRSCSTSPPRSMHSHPRALATAWSRCGPRPWSRCPCRHGRRGQWSAWCSVRSGSCGTTRTSTSWWCSPRP